MPPTDRLVTFAAAAFVLIVVPGPSVLFEISRAVALGRRAGLATVAGNTLGEALQVAIVAIGLGGIVSGSLLLFSVLKIVGAAYIVVLGIRAFRGRRALTGILDSAATPRSTRRIVSEGFVVGATNPKSAVFFAAVLPQFVEPALGHVPVQLLVLGCVWTLIALVSDGTWAYLAGAARDWFARSPRRLELVGGAGGLAMMALGVRLALVGRKD